MFDIKWIRDNPDAFDAGLARRGLGPRAGEILALDEDARKFTHALNDLQERRNAASKQIGAAKAKGGEAEYPSGAIDESIDLFPALPWPERGHAKKIQQAIKPIMLRGIGPDLIENADSIPAHIRGGEPISTIVKNKKPEGGLTRLRTQLDRLIAYYEYAGVDTYSWKADDPEMLTMEWDYFSFDPKKGPPSDRKDKVRYREVELPAGMENWYAKDFDPSKAGWKKGKAPFGQNNGELKPLRKVSGRSYSKIDMMPNTLWEKEVLLMRTEMKMPKFDPDYRYRMVVGGAGHAWEGEGYALYINGELVSEAKSGNYKNARGPRGVFLFEEFQEQFSEKEVTVAVKSFLRMSGHKTKSAPPEGHLNVWVQKVLLPPEVVAKADQEKAQ